MAAHLQPEATADVIWVPTDGRSVEDVTLEALRACGWLEEASSDSVTG